MEILNGTPAVNTHPVDMAGGKRKGAGRKPVRPEMKKEHSKARLSRWVLDWLDEHRDEGSRGELLEAALIELHKLKAPQES